MPRELSAAPRLHGTPDPCRAVVRNPRGATRRTGRLEAPRQPPDASVADSTDQHADHALLIDIMKTLTPRQRSVVCDQFIGRLLTATDPASWLRVVIAVRADFLGRCAEHSGLTAALQDGQAAAGVGHGPAPYAAHARRTQVPHRRRMRRRPWPSLPTAVPSP
jgi:hypothetical protein